MSIKIYDNLFDQEVADQLIENYCKKNNPGNREILTKDIEKDSLLDNFLKELGIYFKFYGDTLDLKRTPYYDKVIAIRNPNGDGTPHPLHFDECISDYPKDLAVSCYVSLIYLSETSKDFQGGQLYFPFQSRLIEPKVGRMICFPSGRLYPHKILPYFGEDRYLLRIFHIFDTELKDKDRQQYFKRVDVPAEKLEL